MIDFDEYEGNANDGLTDEERKAKAAHKGLVKPVKTQAERDKAHLDKFLKTHPRARKLYVKLYGPKK